MKQLNTPNIGFRVKIFSGENLWTSTPYVQPKLKKKGALCEFKKTFRVRVDPRVTDFVIVSLLACPTETGKLPDILQTLKNEIYLGFTKIPLENIPEQKKVLWIPLNDSVALENPYATEDQPILSMNYKLLRNVRRFFNTSIDTGELSGGAAVGQSI